MGPASDSNEPDTTYEVITDTGGIVRLDISKAEARHFWECAYRYPLQVAAQQFALLRKITKEHKVAASVMLVVGCLEYNHRSPLGRCLGRLVKDIGPQGFSSWLYDCIYRYRLATRGALVGKEYALTAEQFISQGVGIGLQRKLPGALEWEEEAQMIFLLCEFLCVKSPDCSTTPRRLTKSLS